MTSSEVSSSKAPPKVKESAQDDFDFLVQHSPGFQKLAKELDVAVRLSLTGITNLVVHYENPELVKSFLNSCFKKKELYHEAIDIDAVELQHDSPGEGASVNWIDELIFGSFVTEQKGDDGIDIPVVSVNPRTGKRRRNSDGFVSRKEVIVGPRPEDRTLIVQNVDNALDFCRSEPGVIDLRALHIFDNFRKPYVKRVCRLLLVTNKRLKLPFKIRTIELNPLDVYEANHLLDAFLLLYRERGGYKVDITDAQKEQIIRKLMGLTYTEAGDAFVDALSKSRDPDAENTIKISKSVDLLRKNVNQSYLQDGFGLTHLKSQPWEDYILPEMSNFTHDVQKILRDLDEIRRIKKLKQTTRNLQLIEAIQQRIQHVILLYGQGGVGKSSFPIHFAGLLDFDVWDFNINATHSMYISKGAEQMRETLKKINQASHVIIRVDEYDRSMGSTAESGQGMHEAHKQVESEFMNWLQNSQEENLFVRRNIFLVLTSNHRENITGPLLRSGRSDLVIDINNFDSQSMKEAFETAARRMNNRGVYALGYSTPEKLQDAVKKLDLARLSEIATSKGFTVRDVDTLIMEMAAHAYYLKKHQEGLPWSTESFAQVLESSTGSVRGESTGELILGDRFISQNKTERDSEQLKFDFMSVSKSKPIFEEC